jgi:hypothetical protein
LAKSIPNRLIFILNLLVAIVSRNSIVSGTYRSSNGEVHVIR